MHQKCSNYALTNLWFGLCRSMWIIDSLFTCPNPHPKAPTCIFTPKVLWARECAQFLSFCCRHLWIHNWVHQGAWGCIKYSVCKNNLIWESCEFGKIKNIDTLVNFRKPNFLKKEMGSCFHNIMQEPELADFHKNNENHPKLV